MKRTMTSRKSTFETEFANEMNGNIKKVLLLINGC